MVIVTNYEEECHKVNQFTGQIDKVANTGKVIKEYSEEIKLFEIGMEDSTDKISLYLR